MTVDQTADPSVLEVYSPVTGERERTREATPTDQLPEIMRRARDAQSRWAALPLPQRRRTLLGFVDHLAARADDCAQRIHHYNGKTFSEALVAEVYPTLGTFRCFANAARRYLRPQKVRLSTVPFAHSVVHHEPLGVVGVIAPWNYPFKIMLQDVPAALMAGNAVVIKVSEHSVAIGELAEELLTAAGLPDHLVQVIYGFGPLGRALIESGIDKVVFTGSTATGRAVYEAAARQLIPCTLEMGGKDAAILLDDADVDDAARGILWAALCNSGQTCASVELAYVPRASERAFVTALGGLIRALPEDSLGAMNVRFQREIVERQVEEAVARGARVAAEGRRADAAEPFRCTPQVLTDVPHDSELFAKETFGPVVAVSAYDDLEQVLGEVNGSPYGLTASVWTRDRARGEQLAHRLGTGVVTINEHMITAAMPEPPWLGHKTSGLGFSQSPASLRAFSRQRYVFHDRGLVKFKFWRYPYTAEKTAWFRSFMKSQFARSVWSRAFHTLRTLPRLLFRANPRFEDGGHRADGSNREDEP